MRKTIKLEIGKNTYEIRQVGARAGSQMILRLGKLLEPLSKGKFEELFSVLSGETFDYIVNEFAKETSCKQTLTTGAKIDLPFDVDEAFAGEYADMILWLKAHFELNFITFLPAMQKLVPPEFLAKAQE